MQKLSNGIAKLLSKDMPVHKIILAFAMKMVMA